jgi:hypothetical protein
MVEGEMIRKKKEKIDKADLIENRNRIKIGGGSKDKEKKEN